MPLTWTTAIHIGHPSPLGAAYAGGVALDGMGNFYTTGSFYAQVALPNPFNLSSTTFTAPGSGLSSFIAKYKILLMSPWLQLLWAKPIASLFAQSSFEATGVAASLDGTCYITGQFNGPVAGFANPLVSGVNEDNLFLASVLPNGTFGWANRIRSNGGRITAPTSGGNTIYAGGRTADTSWFASTGGTVMVPDAGPGYKTAKYVARYGANGAIVWVKSAAGGGLILNLFSTYINSVYTEPVKSDLSNVSVGNVYVTGGADNESGISLITSLISAQNGLAIWTQGTSGGACVGLGITRNPKSAGKHGPGVYVTGAYGGTVKFAPGHAITSVGGAGQAFIAKYDDNGVFQWVIFVEGEVGLESAGSSLAVANGYVYATGVFRGTAEFRRISVQWPASVAVGSVSSPNSSANFGFPAAYLLEIAPDGFIVSHQIIDGVDDQSGIAQNAVGVSAAGSSVCISADFFGTVQCGSVKAASTSLGVVIGLLGA